MIELMQIDSSIGWKIEIHNSQSVVLFPKKANFEKLWLGIDNSCRIYFLSLLANKCF